MFDARAALEGLEAEAWNYVCLSCNQWTACEDGEDSIMHSEDCMFLDDRPVPVVIVFRLKALEEVDWDF